MRLEIVIKVDYDESTVKDKEALRALVEAECERAIGTGILGAGECWANTTTVIDTYELKVEWKNE